MTRRPTLIPANRLAVEPPTSPIHHVTTGAMQ
jgi:hypothetical protein